MNDPIQNLAAVMGLKPMPAAVRPLQPVLVGSPCRLEVRKDNRWGGIEPWYNWFWTAPQAGELPAGDWAKIQDFQTPIDEVKFKLTDDQLAAVGRGGMEAAMKTPIGLEIARKTDLSGQHSTLWQFNVVVQVGPYDFGWMRLVAPLGEPLLVEWSFFDLRVLRPALRLVAGLLNRFNRIARKILKRQED